jgi:hypothetical protein
MISALVGANNATKPHHCVVIVIVDLFRWWTSAAAALGHHMTDVGADVRSANTEGMAAICLLEVATNATTVVMTSSTGRTPVRRASQTGEGGGALAPSFPPRTFSLQELSVRGLENTYVCRV